LQKRSDAEGATKLHGLQANEEKKQIKKEEQNEDAGESRVKEELEFFKKRLLGWEKKQRAEKGEVAAKRKRAHAPGWEELEPPVLQKEE
jgi:hypothetical protein